RLQPESELAALLRDGLLFEFLPAVNSFDRQRRVGQRVSRPAKDRAADDGVRLAFPREFDGAAEFGRFAGRDFKLARDESFIALLFEQKRVTARRKRVEFEVPLVITFRFALIFLVLGAGRADYHAFKRLPITLFHPTLKGACLRLGLRARRSEQ